MIDPDEFRAKYGKPAQTLCMTCKTLPPQRPKRRCAWCLLRLAGTDAEVAAAYERKNAPNKLVIKFEDRILKQQGLGFCYHCNSEIPDFYMHSSRRCRGCNLAANRNSRDKSAYGIDAGTRQQMYVTQDGKCYGCNKQQKFTGLALHHNHATGEPLYLSCKRCNTGMGQMNDDPDIMRRLADGTTYPPHRNITGWNK